MVIFALELAQDGAREITWDEVVALLETRSDARLWLHFDRHSDDARNWLVSTKTLPEFVCDVLFQEDTRPRAFRFDEGIVLNLRGVNFNEGKSPNDLISLRMYADANIIVTTRAHRILSVEDLKTELLSASTIPPSGEMVAFLAHRITERLETVTQRLEEDVDTLEDDMLDQNTPPPKQAVANFRRNVLSIRRYIYPQREAISNLIREGDFLFSDRDKLKLRETQDIVLRLSEQLDMVRERAIVLQEQIAELRAEAMNQRLFVLAIISAVFLPLGFITGLFGVNVGGMPGVSSNAAFWILCAAMGVIVALLFALFRKMKWL